MNLSKAIEILDDMVNPVNTIGNAEDKKAINLGIEALKRTIAWRNDNNDDFLWDFAGETED
jgi:hypothetical protein